MARPRAHLADVELAALAELDASGSPRVRGHLDACPACRGRLAEAIGLRALLSETGRREHRPPRDAVPSAMKRVRLRRYGVTNANELLAGVAAFVRGLATLFSVTARNDRAEPHARGMEDERYG